MRVALIHINREDVDSDAWITRVETVLPGSTLQLARSLATARKELTNEGYSEVCGVQSEKDQVLVFVEAQMHISTPIILLERVKAELNHLTSRMREVDAEVGKSSS